jgi:hypothetical protein
VVAPLPTTAPTVISPIATPAQPAIPTQQAAIGCVQVDPRLGTAWESWAGAELSCPQQTQEIPVALQVFERGFMIWKGGPESQIYVLAAGDGTRPPRWTAYRDTFQEGETALDPLLTPPPGVEQPVRGFGKVWREQPGVRDELGWALAREHGSPGLLQVFEGGRIFLIEDARLFALSDNGSRWQEFPVTGPTP